MNGFGDFFGSLNLVQIVPYAAFTTILIVFVLLLYVFRLRAHFKYPLPNERIISDRLTMWVPRGFGVISGPMTTARNTLERYWTQLIQNEQDADMQEKWEKNRKFVMKKFLFAIKDGNGKKILLFDRNPENQKFLTVDPEGAGMIIHGVQDCKSVGEYGGFEYLGIKLDDNVQSFSEDEILECRTALLNVKFLRDAAKNVEKISEMKEAYTDKCRALDITLKELADTRSKNDRLMSALSMKPLTQREEPKIKGRFSETVKEFFWSSPWQLVTCAAGFLAAPYIVQYGNVSLEPPITMQLFSLILAGVGFFIIPTAQKLFAKLK